jgi:hypothetical protein
MVCQHFISIHRNKYRVETIDVFWFQTIKQNTVCLNHEMLDPNLVHNSPYFFTTQQGLSTIESQDAVFVLFTEIPEQINVVFYLLGQQVINIVT